jgi:hypothetical protein
MPREALAHRPAIVRAIGIGAHVKAGAIMGLQCLDEQQGGGVVLKIAGEIAEADFCPRAAIKTEIEPRAFRPGDVEAIPDPEFGAGALFGGGDAGFRQQMKGRKLAGFAARHDAAQMRRTFAEAVPFAHAALAANRLHGQLPRGERGPRCEAAMTS